MLVIDCPQGSPEWHAARLGIPTASNFDRIVTPARLQPSKGADGYLDQLLADWLLGQPEDEFSGTYWTERGTLLEAEARAYFTAATDLPVREVGFVYRDETRAVGCSPDALVNDVGGLELKCPKLSTHLGYRRAGGLPSEYRMQVHGGMWVTGFARWWFMSYHPGVPPVLIEVERDDKVMTALDEHVPPFLAELATERQALLDEGVEPHTVIDRMPLPDSSGDNVEVRAEGN